MNISIVDNSRPKGMLSSHQPETRAEKVHSGLGRKANCWAVLDKQSHATMRSHMVLALNSPLRYVTLAKKR
jgi:hypothetical protein